MATTLHQGQGAEVLRALPERCADMIYLDPPFGTNLVWKGKAGSFSDKFVWDARQYADLAERNSLMGAFIQAAPIGRAQKAYLVMMGDLLLQCRRALKLAATLWLHCDDTSSHYLKVITDLIFGPRAFLGEIVSKRSTAHSNKKRSYGRVHDNILVFARSRVAHWRLARVRCEFMQGDPCDGVIVDGIVDGILNQAAKERVGYPTQKPVALLERFLGAGCIPGGTVIDPTCGSGTTLVAARNLGMSAIGIDLSEDAIAACRKRLEIPARAQLQFAALAA